MKTIEEIHKRFVALAKLHKRSGNNGHYGHYTDAWLKVLEETGLNENNDSVTESFSLARETDGKKYSNTEGPEGVSRV